jgi:hypothetical protein
MKAKIRAVTPWDNFSPRTSQPVEHGSSKGVVFDNGRSIAPREIQQTGAESGIIFRRSANDNRKPSRVVTAQIMGDPPPGRSAQDQYEAAQAVKRNYP